MALRSHLSVKRNDIYEINVSSDEDLKTHAAQVYCDTYIILFGKNGR